MRKVNYNRILYAFMTLLSLLFVGYVSLSNIIPFKYIMLIFEIMMLWDLILYLTLIYKTKIGKNIKRKIVGYIICVFLIIIMVIISYYLMNTMNFFRTFGSNKYKEENYLILIRNESNYEKIEDLENMGYVKQELGNLDKAIDKIKEKKSIDIINYEYYNSLMKALIDTKIESLIIEESYYQMLDETLNYSGYFKVLDKISIITEIEHDTDVNVIKSPFSIYISGIDTYGNIGGVSRSDVNMVVTVNPITKQILFVSIPRDYYVQLRGTKGYKDKLTHAGVFGIDMSIGTLEDLLDVTIDYYYRVNFSTLEQVVDAIDGIDVYSKYDFTSGLAAGGVYHFQKGYNHLNGNQSLAFSRERHNMPNGDRDRGVNQQAVLDGIIRKVISPTIITKYTAILNSLKNTFQTNMTETEIQKLIKMQLNDMATWNITSYNLNGYDGDYEYTYSNPSQKLYVMHPYENTVNEAKNLIDRVYNGEILDSSYGTVSDVKIPEAVAPKYPSKPTVPEVVTPEVPPSIDPVEPEEPSEPAKPDFIIPGMPEDEIKDDKNSVDEEPEKPNEPNLDEEDNYSKPNEDSSSGPTNDDNSNEIDSSEDDKENLANDN